MKPSEVSKAVELCVSINQPVFVWGKPGVGKSSVINQAAARLGLPVVDMRLSLLDPVDLRGLPHVNGDGRAHWATPAFLPREGRGILFMDEYVQGMRSVQSAAGQLVYDRRLGEYTLPDGWAIVAAGNNLTDRAATNDMPSHVKRRFTHLEYEIDISDFQRHALTAGFRMEVIAFLQHRSELLHEFAPDAKNFPCPGTWEFVSRILDACPAPEIERALYAGAVGEGAAAEFVGFLRVWRNLPSIDQILLSPGTAAVPTDPATLFAICGSLAKRSTENNFGAVTAYGARLPREFSVVLVTQAVTLHPEIKNVRAFAQWASDNTDVLV